MKYRKKPVVIDAIQFDGTSEGADAVIDFTGDDHGCAWMEGDGVRRYEVYIDTLEGRMTAQAGDWVIRGTQGEFYPCKPKAFADTFEPVED